MYENWDVLEVFVLFLYVDVGVVFVLCVSCGWYCELEKMLEKCEGGVSAGDWAETFGRAGRAAVARVECECVWVFMVYDMDVDDVLLLVLCVDGVEDDVWVLCVGLLLRGGADVNCRNYY